MARWRDFTYRYLTNFDGCGFGKYCYILLGPTLLMPLNPSHNLLLRVPNLCGPPLKSRVTGSEIAARFGNICGKPGARSRTTEPILLFFEDRLKG